MRNQKYAAQNSPFRVVPKTPWRVAKVQPHPGYRLTVWFLDGLEGQVDLSKLVNDPKAGVFAALRDMVLFNQVYVDLGVVTWPGEIDLAPDAMYQEIKEHGFWLV
jgi:hypothetical protein